MTDLKMTAKRVAELEGAKERPILFSGPMVRALLAGTKTQTRRVVKPQPFARPEKRDDENAWDVYAGDELCGTLHCPYGQPGDRLWVRETFKAVASGEVKNGYGEVRYGFAYQSDGETSWQERPTIIHDLTGQPPTGPMQFKPVPWKPSIHMPRRASRITLEIVSVRVERLNEISEADAKAEGITSHRFRKNAYAIPAMSDGHYMDTARDSFAALWESINGAGSWAANPLVWVVEFRRLP